MALKSKVNTNTWFWHAPEYFSRWRIFPRAFIIVYFWLIVQTAMWFMGITTPTPAQAAFASAIIGAGAAWFGLYVNSGNAPVSSLSPSQRATIEANTTDLNKAQEANQVEPKMEYKPRVVGQTESTNVNIEIKG